MAVRDEGGEKKDRLSSLPDDILLRIFSFLSEFCVRSSVPSKRWKYSGPSNLGSKLCVRTSVLSKRWKYLWTSVPNLIFDRYEYPRRKGSKFKKLVLRVLSRRNDVPVTKFSLDYTGNDKSLVTTLINYAVSHNVQHLRIGIVYHLDYLALLSPLLNNCYSLKTLQFNHIDFYRREDILLTLPNLTNLYLSSCLFYGNGESIPIDPFVGLVNLKNLQLDCCDFWNVGTLKISGPILDSLTITSEFASVDCMTKVEVVAPKLRFFNFVVPKRSFEYRDGHMKFSHLHFPLLEIADIDVDLSHCAGNTTKEAILERLLLDLIDMFRGLYNAHSLVLSSSIIEGLMKCPGVLKDQASPFVRLKTLKVKCPSPSSTYLNIPHNVIKYFGQNITVEKI